VPESDGWRAVLAYRPGLFEADEVQALADDLVRALDELRRPGALDEEPAAVIARIALA
jgi:hypothetical protein